MPKFLDYLRPLVKPLKLVVSASSPIGGILIGVAEELFIKPTKKVNVMLEGKKTYIGIGVTAIAFVAQFMGYEVSAEEQSGLNEAILAIMGAFGLLFATYGRVKTTKK